MTFPVDLPLAPMLAKAAPAVPEGNPGDDAGAWLYEPKWDGFRCLVMRDGDRVELYGRGRKPLTRYFPEVVEQARATLPAQCLLDGELVTPMDVGGSRRLDWDTLSARIHPADSRVQRLAAETPAEYVAFDLLARGSDSLIDTPLTERRQQLTEVFAALRDCTWAHLGGQTDDPALAREWFERFEGAGLDGVIAKPAGGVYQPGKRGWLKIKHKRTAEAVVLGYRIHTSGDGVGSLLLGLATPGSDEPVFHHVGGIVSFPAARRLELIDELEPWVMREEDGSVVDAASDRTRFSSSTDRSFVPLRPERVVEVAFDQLEGERFRHAVSFLRWRDDRDPASCTLDQIDRAPTYDLREVFDETQL